MIPVTFFARKFSIELMAAPTLAGRGSSRKLTNPPLTVRNGRIAPCPATILGPKNPCRTLRLLFTSVTVGVVLKCSVKDCVKYQKCDTLHQCSPSTAIVGIAESRAGFGRGKVLLLALR